MGSFLHSAVRVRPARTSADVTSEAAGTGESVEPARDSADETRLTETRAVRRIDPVFAEHLMSRVSSAIEATPSAAGVATAREVHADQRASPTTREVHADQRASTTTVFEPTISDSTAVPTSPAADPSLDKVDPALRSRVEKIIERMRDEFGHEVSVVEGYRSSERQQHLYEQGRTRPGKIATWTRASWHSEGLAADLIVDGSYDDPLAYARLQRVAREEGLKTLGSRDMGHVELPQSELPEGEAPPAARSGRRFVGVARPASVASPAAPAGVARVAEVATPGQWVTDPVVEPATPGAPGTEREAEPDEGTLSAAREQPRGADSAARGDFSSQLAESRSTAAAPRTPVEAASETNAAEQVAKVAELRAMAETLQPSRVSVRLDGPGGDQLRVGLLDRSIDADLDISDPERAHEMRSRVAELHGALASRGLELGALSVNGTTGPANASGWLAGSTDPAAEIIRSLLGGGADQESDGRGAGRQDDERRNNPGGSGSNRSRRDANKERNK